MSPHSHTGMASDRLDDSNPKLEVPRSTPPSMAPTPPYLTARTGVANRDSPEEQSNGDNNYPISKMPKSGDMDVEMNAGERVGLGKMKPSHRQHQNEGKEQGQDTNRDEYHDDEDEEESDDGADDQALPPVMKRTSSGDLSDQKDGQSEQAPSSYPVERVKRRRKVSATPRLNTKTTMPVPETAKNRLARDSKDYQMAPVKNRNSIATAPDPIMNPPRTVVKDLQNKFRASLTESSLENIMTAARPQASRFRNRKAGTKHRFNQRPSSLPMGSPSFEQYVSGTQVREDDSDNTKLPPRFTQSSPPVPNAWSSSPCELELPSHMSNGRFPNVAEGKASLPLLIANTRTSSDLVGLGCSSPSSSSPVSALQDEDVGYASTLGNITSHPSYQAHLGGDSPISQSIFTSPNIQVNSYTHVDVFQQMHKLQGTYRLASEAASRRETRLTEEIKRLKNENSALQEQLTDGNALWSFTTQDREKMTKAYQGVKEENQKLRAEVAKKVCEIRVSGMAHTIIADGDHTLSTEGEYWIGLDDSIGLKIREHMLQVSRLCNVQDLVRECQEHTTELNKNDAEFKQQVRSLIHKFAASQSRSFQLGMHQASGDT